MKTYPFVLLSAENIARLYTILRGSEVIQFTDHGSDLLVGGDLYVSLPSAQMTDLQFSVDGTVSSATVILADDEAGPLSDAEAAIGRYDGYPIQIACCDSAQPELGAGEMFTGYIGEINADEFGLVTIECRGPLTRLRGDITEQYSTNCRADLGDERCKFPILRDDIERNTAYVSGSELLSFVRVRAFSNDEPEDYGNIIWECTTSGTTASVQPDYSGSLSPGSTVTDGNAVFTARNAELRAAEVDEVVSAQSFSMMDSADPREVEDWYQLGAAIIRTGRYAGTLVPIRSYDVDTLTVRCWFLVSHMLEPGDKIEIYRGCPKTEAGCNSFVWSFGPEPRGNIWNRRAETFAPGEDAARAQAN